MSVERRNADGFALQVMIGLCLIWGVQQVMIKWAAPDIAPVMQAGLQARLANLPPVPFSCAASLNPTTVDLVLTDSGAPDPRRDPAEDASKTVLVTVASVAAAANGEAGA